MDLGNIGSALAVIGIGLSLGGCGVGIGLIGAGALEAIARQPEEMKTIRLNMFLIAALVEGLGLFGAVIGLLVIFKG